MRDASTLPREGSGRGQVRRRDEETRLRAVRRYDILDTPPDGTFDRITALAARMLRVPIAVVSIVDEDRIWFKSRHGVDVDQIPRDPGLCASAILQPGPFVLTDARLDPVALSNPLVAGEFGLRFYAAVPLRTPDGHNLGTLAVIDRSPRHVSDEELSVLGDLAALVVNELEVRLAARLTVAHEVELRKAAETTRRSAERLATALQATLLPPHLPTIPGMELEACYRAVDPAGVGGDFYDVFALPRRAWGLVVGDVCGKGPDAAALTSAARYAARAAALEHNSPAAVLRKVNDALRLGGEDVPERFCTLLYARLRPHGSEYQVTVASGGHPLPQVLRADGGVESFGTPGTIVGAFEDPEIEDVTVRLRAGDAVAFFTDGLVEAGAQPSQLGVEGVARLLRAARGESARTIVAKLAAEAANGDGRRRDDLVVVCLRALDRPHPTPQPAAATPGLAGARGRD